MRAFVCHVREQTDKAQRYNEPESALSLLL